MFNSKKQSKWHKFFAGQKREIKELSRGQENFPRFFRDSANLLKDLFIPYSGNNHQPKVLRSKSLINFAVAAILVKVIVTGFLFFTYPTPAQLSAIISKNIISLVNKSRVEAGVEPLKENFVLVKFAELKGQDMINRNYFAHDTPEGKKPWQWIDRSEYDYVYAGENLAMDFTNAEDVSEAFLKSPTHRRNILNNKYKEIGVAVLSGQLSGHRTTLLVEFFGTQRKDLSSLAAGKPVEQPVTAKPKITPEETVKKPKVAGEQNIDDNVNISENGLPGSLLPNNEGVITVTTDNTRKLIDFVIEYSNIFFIAFLIFMIISLILNIFIRIDIQHPSVILQSVALIALLLAMILVKFHFVEQVASNILIL
ncbi:MAG: CAP domain-containing protein [Patescibacteria group bacterium]|jgi:uncharacterized protein YkwD